MVRQLGCTIFEDYEQGFRLLAGKSPFWITRWIVFHFPFGSLPFPEMAVSGLWNVDRSISNGTTFTHPPHSKPRVSSLLFSSFMSFSFSRLLSVFMAVVWSQKSCV